MVSTAFHIRQSVGNRTFAASHSRGKKPRCWRTKVALGQDKQRKLPFQIMYVFCLSCPSATFVLQCGGFVPHEWLAAMDLFLIDWYWSISQWKLMVTTFFTVSTIFFMDLIMLLFNIIALWCSAWTVSKCYSQTSRKGVKKKCLLLTCRSW